MINRIYSFIIFLFRLIKKVFIWSSSPGSIDIIKAQLSLIDMGFKHFGVKTDMKPYLDVADDTVTMAKTFLDIVDGQQEEMKDRFINMINNDKGPLEGLEVFIGNDTVGIDFAGVRGTYNTKNKGFKLGLHLN